jgi:GNAT superfamily N-acetyltransferase
VGQTGNNTVAIDRISELLDMTPLVVAVPGEPATIQPPPLPSVHWLPGVVASPDALSDPHGWYQRGLTEDAVGTGVNVVQLAIGNLSPDERQQAQAFTRHTLQRSVERVRPFALPANSYTWASPTWFALVKAEQRVVAHAGIIYRVIQIGDLRVPVGGIAGVMTLPGWRQRGYARAALAKATAFVGRQLWAPFALVICPREDTAFYEHLGWRITQAPILCDQPGGRVKLEHEVALYVPCQGDADWPTGPIDVCGAPW